MEHNISRRNFIKGSGVVVLSVACSGLLAGCGGSGSSMYTVNLGDFKVSISGISFGETYSSSSATYNFIPKIKIKLSGDRDKLKKTYKELFSASIDGTALTLKNGSEKLKLTDGTIFGIGKNDEEVCSPEFVVTKEQYENAIQNKSVIELRVMPYGSNNQVALYKINTDEEVTFYGYDNTQKTTTDSTTDTTTDTDTEDTDDTTTEN